MGLLEAPRGPRWGLKGAPKRSFENSGCHREPAKAPKEPPRSPQEHPKRAQESPKTLSRACFDRKPCFFENRAPAEVKSRFLRVGGSAWELKIDPKRLRKKIKYDIEERKNENQREEAARSKQTRRMIIRRGIWKHSVVDVEAPQSPQETPRSFQKESKRGPKRSQNHVWI